MSNHENDSTRGIEFALELLVLILFVLMLNGPRSMVIQVRRIADTLERAFPLEESK